jgi:hypothetical protein
MNAVYIQTRPSEWILSQKITLELEEDEKKKKKNHIEGYHEDPEKIWNFFWTKKCFEIGPKNSCLILFSEIHHDNDVIQIQQELHSCILQLI